MQHEDASIAACVDRMKGALRSGRWRRQHQAAARKHNTQLLRLCETAGLRAGILYQRHAGYGILSKARFSFEMMS